MSILKDINDWLKDLSPDSQRLFLLTGGAGTGKTTIATTVSEQVREEKYLACRFFCGQGTTPTALFKSLAFRLSEVSGLASDKICKVLRDHNFAFEPFGSSQVKKVFIKPLIAAASSSKPLIAVSKKAASPILIIIDALDTSSSPTEILGYFADAIKAHPPDTLPPKVKIFLTSRPVVVQSVLNPPLDGLIHRHISTSDEEANKDVKTYVKSKIDAAVMYANKALDPNWPGEHQIDALCRQASGLFIWAASVTSYIRRELDARPVSSVDDVFRLIQGEGMAMIDKLYLDLLTREYEPDVSRNADYVAFRKVISVLIGGPRGLADLEKRVEPMDREVNSAVLGPASGREPGQAEPK
jgi:hypothetical protein